MCDLRCFIAQKTAGLLQRPEYDICLGILTVVSTNKL